MAPNAPATAGSSPAAAGSRAGGVHLRFRKKLIEEPEKGVFVPGVAARLPLQVRGTGVCFDLLPPTRPSGPLGLARSAPGDPHAPRARTPVHAPTAVPVRRRTHAVDPSIRNQNGCRGFQRKRQRRNSVDGRNERCSLANWI